MRSILVVLTLAGCSGTSMSGGDAAVPGVVVKCDVVGQSCPNGSRCDFTCEQGMLVIDCTPEVPGAAQVGQACSGRDAGSTGASSSCARGSGCFGSGTKGPLCYRYCRAGSECPAGTTCDTTSMFRAVCPGGSGNLPVGLCR